VPVISFAEPDNNQGPKSVWTWFAGDQTRPLTFFVGIWRESEGDGGTKAAPLSGTHLVYSFLTTDASPDVAPIHPDATPVLLLEEEARETWMNAPWEIARELQRPPPGERCRW
jgi:putative SOS response-associated peptidase YedK